MKLRDYTNQYLPNGISTNFRSISDIEFFVESIGEVVAHSHACPEYRSVSTESGYIVMGNGYVVDAEEN